MIRKMLVVVSAAALLSLAPSEPSRQDDVESIMRRFREVVDAAARDYNDAIRGAATKARTALEVPRRKAAKDGNNPVDVLKALRSCDQYALGLDGQLSFFLSPASYELRLAGAVTGNIDFKTDGTFRRQASIADSENSGTWTVNGPWLTLTWGDGVIQSLVFNQPVFSLGDVSLRWIDAAPFDLGRR